MLSANVIERGGLYLTNLVKNGSAITNSNRVYGISFNYSQWLIPDHTYYYSFKYKYNDPANSSQAPNRVALFYADGMGKAFVADSEGKDTWFSVSGTSETTYLGLFTPTNMWAYSAQGSWGYGSVYHKYVNGSTTITSGVAKMQLREVVVTDVTFLYKFYKGQGKTDNEIISSLNSYGDLAGRFYTASGVKECVLFPIEQEYTDRSWFKKSYAYSPIDFIECDGMTAYSVGSLGKDCYFDEGDKTGIYNYGTFTTNPISKKRVIDTSSPFYPKHNYVLQIKTTGADISTGSSSTDNCWPKLGGIFSRWSSAANMVVVEKVVAKIPVGYNLCTSNNSLGTGWKCEPNSLPGTGKYEEYTFKYTCGSSGTFSTSGFLYINPVGTNADKKNVTWYIAYINYCTLADTNITDWCAMPGSVKTNGYNIYTSEIDSQNLFLNGNGSDTNMPLPSEYEWFDTVSKNLYFNGYTALKLNITTGSSTSWYDQNNFTYIGQKIPINPFARYKITGRVYSVTGVSRNNFLPTIFYYTSENSNPLFWNEYTYDEGTKTLVKQKVSKGATTIYLDSVTNWKTGSCLIGYRPGPYYSVFSKRELVNITNVDITNKTITLASGVTNEYAANGYLCQTTEVTAQLNNPRMYEYYRLSTFLNPGWTSIESYIGNYHTMWDGRRSILNGFPSLNIPFGVKYISFCPNMCHNYGGSSILFDDFRIEEISEQADKKEQKVQIKHYIPRPGTIIDPDAKYILYINFPSSDGEYNTQKDIVNIDGTDYTYSEYSIEVSLTSGKHTVSYKPCRYTYYGIGPQRLNTLLEWISDGITISNGEFDMPMTNASLTWTYSGNLVYKVKASNKIDLSKDSSGLYIYPDNTEFSTDLKVGASYKTCTEIEMYFPLGSTVYWQLNPQSTKYIYPRVTFKPDSILPSSDDFGSFTMPNEDVTITGISYGTPSNASYLEHAMRLTTSVDPGSVKRSRNGAGSSVLSTSWGAGAKFNDYITLELIDGNSTSNGCRTCVELLSIQTKDVKLLKIQQDQYSFSMPFADVEITPEFNKYFLYHVEVDNNKTQGCTIGVGTANSTTATNSDCWVEKNKSVFVNVNYSGSTNLCTLTVTDTSGSNLSTINNVGSNTNFQYSNNWPNTGVKVYGIAKEDIWVCPFNGFVVYSIASSSGSRLIGNVTSNTMEIFNGFNNERSKLPDINAEGSLWRTLVDTGDTYGSNPDFGENPVCHMGAWNITVVCAFSVDISNNGEVYITAHNYQGEQIANLQFNYTPSDTHISGTSTNNDLSYDFVRTEHNASGKASYFGVINYNYNQLQISIHNILVRLEENYLINFVYDTEISDPPFYPGYTPSVSLAAESIKISPVRKVDRYYLLDATTYDRLFFNITDASGNPPENINVTLENFDEVYIGFAYTENADIDTIYESSDLNPRHLFNEMFADYQEFNRTYSTNISVQDNTLMFTIAELLNDEYGLSQEELENVQNSTGTLIVTIGTKNTIFTFFIGAIVNDYLDIKQVIKDTDNSNMWTGNYTVSTSEGEIDAQCLNVNFN